MAWSYFAYFDAYGIVVKVDGRVLRGCDVGVVNVKLSAVQEALSVGDAVGDVVAAGAPLPPLHGDQPVAGVVAPAL